DALPMHAIITRGLDEWASRPAAGVPLQPATAAQPQEESSFQHAVAVACTPNVLARWMCYLSAFSIPFTQLYVPGTGERVGVTRLVQVLMFAAVLSQPRICLRFVPIALFWFVAYCAIRIIWGLWLSPELSA